MGHISWSNTDNYVVKICSQKFHLRARFITRHHFCVCVGACTSYHKPPLKWPVCKLLLPRVVWYSWFFFLRYQFWDQNIYSTYRSEILEDFKILKILEFRNPCKYFQVTFSSTFPSINSVFYFKKINDMQLWQSLGA